MYSDVFGEIENFDIIGIYFFEIGIMNFLSRSSNVRIENSQIVELSISHLLAFIACVFMKQCFPSKTVHSSFGTFAAADPKWRNTVPQKRRFLTNFSTDFCGNLMEDVKLKPDKVLKLSHRYMGSLYV